MLGLGGDVHSLSAFVLILFGHNIVTCIFHNLVVTNTYCKINVLTTIYVKPCYKVEGGGRAEVAKISCIYQLFDNEKSTSDPTKVN